jgi:uncharacterized membrane protein YjjB (DUF3815 family)
VTFLPGGLLTTATLDLSAGQVISGASQLVAGTMQLVLLSFGIVAGAQIAGIPAEVAITNGAKNTLRCWAPWLGVVVFGIGAFVHFSGPRGSLGWSLIVLVAARLDHFVHTVVVFIAIGLGVLVGNALVLRRRGFSRRAAATGPSR